MGTKISELTALTTPVAADLLVIVDTTASPDTTKKITITSLSTILAPLASPSFTGTVTLPNNGVIIGETALKRDVDNGGMYLYSGIDSSGAGIQMWGKNAATPGVWRILTPDAALNAVVRLSMTGAVNTSVITCASLTWTGLDITSTSSLKHSGTQVVGARVVDARCDDVINSGDATTDGVIDSLRDAMITHGLIAAA